MAKYVMYKSATEILFPPKNKGSIINYDKNIELLIEDGYKELIEVERPQTNRFYHIEYVETDVISETIIYDETQEEADLRDLENAKSAKISENDTKRDNALNQGVEYREVLFDSDTDQKVNLLAIVSTMNDEDDIAPEGASAHVAENAYLDESSSLPSAALSKIVWFGMDNQPLECTKQDLINIGSLITQLHAFCWSKNAQIKGLISAAQSIAEVEEIDIDYRL